ncbi:PKD domain-containing protein [Antricoccus suffuscus]|uniref:PKD domain-containing protein n=1 Tax=Antricoccus suffuscus TaxID=1629062 RepID=A0A2T0ZZX7_9ACTN|nr:PKD domain-containing protein [Antricoccus suffuscus]PRZ41909.1 PKD domain-containing protein [Antricoccus suffuscus]
MTYPLTWQPGDVLGRNYVPRPHWMDAGSSTTDIAPWTSGTLGQRDVANGLGTINRLASFTLTRIKLDGLPIESGRQYVLRMLAFVSDPAQTVKVGIVANGGNDTAPVAGYDVTIPPNSGYQWVEVNVTTPDKQWRNSLGTPFTPTAMDLIITATSAVAIGFAMVRLDEPGSPISGRLDGDATDTTDWDFGWTATTNRSASTATALTAYPTASADEAPTAAFIAAATDLTLDVDASASSDPEESTLSYGWDFGDGATGSGVTASHTYAADGAYVVTLTVTDTAGNAAGSTKTAHVSAVTGTDPTPDPEPGSGPITALIAEVVAFMGRTGDAALEALAAEHVPVMAEIVNAYVRGNGPTRTGSGLGEFDFPPDLRAVTMTASARLLNNPAQLESESADGYAARGRFESFSLAEQAILHRYRRRSA